MGHLFSENTVTSFHVKVNVLCYSIKDVYHLSALDACNWYMDKLDTGPKIYSEQEPLPLALRSGYRLQFFLMMDK